MKSKSFVAVVLVLLLGVAAYWYWSPFLALRQLQTAARNGEAEEFNRHVDYPKLRESLKDQFSALVAQKLGTPKDPGNPLAALGSMIGLGLVNQLVDVMVRPETVMAAMSHGRLAQPAPAPTPAPGQAAPESSPPRAEGEQTDNKPRWIIDRQGASRITAFAIDPAKPDEPNSERLGLVFERSGFVDWKLTEIRMPASALRK
ncbi:DUF2939 domain-containing protein [Variovorax sp. YR216]|uniref:DUF2939 domain-containing protein n=1 Tax=Variovorax sp. YR216 TaxID=1882828 RepID=UPI00089B3900|nr:DUF2939 domain-containing protein [Variovorax sp. YR216]SEA89888.1 Protein of unknown function [Variovorax sp. YR216]